MTAQTSDPQRMFFLTHVYLPLVFFVALVMLVEYAGLDFLVQDYFYNLHHGEWKNPVNNLLDQYLHDMPRYFLKRFVMCVWLVTLVSWILPSRLMRGFLRQRLGFLEKHRGGLLFLSLALPLGPSLTGLLKHTTYIDCPWSLTRYGGTEIFQSIYALPVSGGGRCFPSSHASSGFGLLPGYFFMRFYRMQNGKRVLWACLLTGWLFGLVQVIRGAHFVSHVVWSFGLCWFAVLLCYALWLFLQKGVSGRVGNT